MYGGPTSTEQLQPSERRDARPATCHTTVDRVITHECTTHAPHDVILQMSRLSLQHGERH